MAKEKKRGLQEGNSAMYNKLKKNYRPPWMPKLQGQAETGSKMAVLQL